MTKLRGWLSTLAGVIVALGLLSSPGAAGGLPLLREGARGPEVVLLQHLLYRLGYLSEQPDGVFGPRTAAALVAYQRDEGLTVDGVAGPDTWARLRGRYRASIRHRVAPGETVTHIARRYGVPANALVAANGLKDPDKIRAGTYLTVPGPAGDSAELALWREVNRLFPYGTVARVIDVDTGRSFQVRRFYGSNHADVEPLTLEDTRVMRQLYGGRWSWERRAIHVELAGRRFAASMNGQPHGQGAVKANGFPGHFCIHFLGSRTHGSGRPDPEHHRQLMRAAGYDTVPAWLRAE